MGSNSDLCLSSVFSAAWGRGWSLVLSISTDTLGSALRVHHSEVSSWWKAKERDWSYVHIIPFSMNSNSTKLDKVAHTHRTSRRSGWPRGLGELNPSPLSWIFTSVSVDSSSRFYLFTSGTVRIPCHTAQCNAPLSKSRRNHRSYV